MTNHINFKEENMDLKDSFKIYNNFLQLETYQKNKVKPKKVVEKFKVFDEKIVLKLQIIDESFTLFKFIRLYTDIKLQICNYTNNYTAMTVTIYYYYYLNNCYNYV